MNHIIAGRPAPICDGTASRFFLRAGHPPAASGLPPGIIHVPCRVFDAFAVRRKTLPGRKHRKVRAKAAGRLEQIVSAGGGRWKNGRNNRLRAGNLERIVQQGFLRRRRK